jgi:hypothetical protein
MPSTSVKRKLNTPLKIRQQEAKKLGQYIPSKKPSSIFYDPKGYAAVHKRFESIRSTKRGKSISALKAWGEATRKEGYGIAKKGTKNYKELQKAVACRMAKSKSCKGVRSESCRKYRKTCNPKKRTTKSKSRSKSHSKSKSKPKST